MPFPTPQELADILPNPKEVVLLLDQFIIGQNSVKKALALMMFRRGLIGMQAAGRLPPSPTFDKSNVMIIGASGTGKTASIKALAKVMDTPIGIYDVTELTASGYVGKEVDSVLERYVLECEDWAEAHPQLYFPHEDEEITDSGAANSWDIACSKVRVTVNEGVIYLDEIDKIRRKETSGNDVGGDSVQSELLKILEGCEFDLWQETHRKKGARTTAANIHSVNTANISFICGGAFEGLDEIIRHRLKKNSGIGFNNDIIMTNPDDLIQSVTTEDLITYGFRPELLGRVPLRACTQQLTAEDLQRIIVEPHNNLYDQYKLVFKLFDINLTIEKEAIKYLADQAVKMKTGARSLKQVFTSLLTDLLYDIYNYMGNDVNINLQYVKDRL